MRLLLDTHFAIWLAQGGGQMTPAERQLVSDHSEHAFVSTASIWEVRLKWYSFHASGARKGTVAPADVLSAMVGMGLSILPITAEHAAEVLHMPLQHSDPFDELLLVQAQVEGLRLLTRDRALAGHPLVVTGQG